MDVAIVVHNYDCSEGTGRYATELLPRVASAHEVTLYAARIGAPVPDGVRVITVPAVTSRTYATILTFPKGFESVRRRHDVVHAQGWVTGSADVVTAHVVLHAWRRRAREAGARPAIGERLLGSFVQFREARLYRSATRIIAPSRKVAGELARHYGRFEAVDVVYHGFSQPAKLPERPTARRQLGLPLDVMVALFVGDPRKGLATAIRAVTHEPRIHLAVATHTSRERVMGTREATALGPRLHWLGALPNLGPAYAASDVLLHPSIYDSFGLPVAEAMACGLPVVVSRETGVAELIEHGRDGFIVHGDMVGELRLALSALLADANLGLRLSRAALDRARTRTWDDVARETIEVYQRAHLRAGPPGSPGIRGSQ